MRRFCFLALFASGLWAGSLVAGCSDDSKNPVEPPAENPCGEILVVATDYATGSLALASGDSLPEVTPDVAAIHADAIARVHGGLVWVVNRFGADNVQLIDPGDGFRTVRQFTVGTGTNPRDIAVVAENRAYVSRALSTSILVVDPRNGSQLGEIDLAPFADADGVPDMDRLLHVASRVYVAIQRIDFGNGSYLPVSPSMILAIDTATDSLVDFDPATDGTQGIVLEGLNPIAPMIWDASRAEILVPEAGMYGVADAGVERVDPSLGRSVGWMLREQDLGGDLIDFALQEDGEKGFATLSFSAGASLGTRLVAFDPASGAVTDTLHSSESYDLADVAVTRCGVVLVCDRSYAASGLRAFRAEDGVPLPGPGAVPIPTGLLPFELVLLDED